MTNTFILKRFSSPICIELRRVTFSMTLPCIAIQLVDLIGCREKTKRDNELRKKNNWISWEKTLNQKQRHLYILSGESGAGKTENTKKVIAYFANVGASTKKPKEGEAKKVLSWKLATPVCDSSPVPISICSRITKT